MVSHVALRMASVCITDLKYAAHYFNTPPNKTLEKYFDKEYMILDEPTVIFIEKVGNK